MEFEMLTSVQLEDATLNDQGGNTPFLLLLFFSDLDTVVSVTEKLYLPMNDAKKKKKKTTVTRQNF